MKLLILSLLIFPVINSGKNVHPIQPANTSLLFKIDFGTGENPGIQLSEIKKELNTPYIYQEKAIGNIPSDVVYDGYYALVNKIPSNNSWFYGAKDHTGNPNGYMVLFNATEYPGVFFTQQINDLCPNHTYEYEVWLANIVDKAKLPAGVPPNIIIDIIDLKNESIIASMNTGELVNTDKFEWKSFKITFSTAFDIKQVKVVMKNTNIGGLEKWGNDFALDDISLREITHNESRDTISSDINYTFRDRK